LARNNYSFNKYQREIAKKKKAEEKRQRKLEKKTMAAEAAPAPQQAPDDQVALE